jgi:hypothetical protein
MVAYDCVMITIKLKVKSKLNLRYDRRWVGQCALVSNLHLRLKTRFLLLSDSCGFVDMGPASLTRGRVCSLQLLLVLVSAVILWSES